MRGDKFIFIFLLLALATAQWIQQVPKNEQPIPISQPQVKQLIKEEKLASAKWTQQARKEQSITVAEPDVKKLSIKEPVQLTIKEVHPHQNAPTINKQPIITQEVQIASAVPIPEPIQENPTTIFPDYQDSVPDHEKQEPHQHRHKMNKHKKGKHHDKMENVATGSPMEEQNEGCLEMLMDNGTLLLVVMGVIGLVLVKVCIKSGKCQTRRGCRPINPARQAINMAPQVQNTGIDAIEETIRYHEAQILKLRNGSYSNMQPAYMPYQ